LCGLAATALNLRARVIAQLNNVHLHEKTTQ
jgi:hypothetical protein